MKPGVFVCFPACLVVRTALNLLVQGLCCYFSCLTTWLYILYKYFHVHPSKPQVVVAGILICPCHAHAYPIYFNGRQAVLGRHSYHAQILRRRLLAKNTVVFKHIIAIIVIVRWWMARAFTTDVTAWRDDLSIQAKYINMITWCSKYIIYRNNSKYMEILDNIGTLPVIVSKHTVALGHTWSRFI